MSPEFPVMKSQERRSDPKGSLNGTDSRRSPERTAPNALRKATVFKLHDISHNDPSDLHTVMIEFPNDTKVVIFLY